MVISCNTNYICFCLHVLTNYFWIEVIGTYTSGAPYKNPFVHPNFLSLLLYFVVMWKNIFLVFMFIFHSLKWPWSGQLLTLHEFIDNGVENIFVPMLPWHIMSHLINLQHNPMPTLVCTLITRVPPPYPPSTTNINKCLLMNIAYLLNQSIQMPTNWQAYIGKIELTFWYFWYIEAWLIHLILLIWHINIRWTIWHWIYLYNYRGI